MTAASVAVSAAVIFLPAMAAQAAPAAVSTPSASMASTDALPTAQIDGIVWTQVVVGDTVYAGGKFANARPSGAAPGTQLTPRGNLLAYNIRTGALVTTFAPNLNGQVQSVAASPDGTRLYVGGVFTQADGQNRYRIAAYDTATGKLVSSFSPGVDAGVNAIVATNATVYVGGDFTQANGVARSRLAAFSASTGALLAWNPAANYLVRALVLTPDKSKVIAGGSFWTINGSSAEGLAALDATTGALLPWNTSNTVYSYGYSAGIMSLAVDNSAIYGTSYDYFGYTNLEGAFSANPDTGTMNWIEDCHGDTYSIYPGAGAVYTVSHAHSCLSEGAFDDDGGGMFYHRALAFSTQPTGTSNANTNGEYPWSHGGQPSPTLYNWFPELTAGSVSGTEQAAWNVTGNSQYVVMGGEFPTVNGIGQQGLVRFAVPPTGTHTQGIVYANSAFTPTLTAPGPGQLQVSFPADWDRDATPLTYKIIRNGDISHPIYTATVNSTFWNRPTISFIDSGLKPSTAYQYRLAVTDPWGQQVYGDTVSATTSTAGAPYAYGYTTATTGRTIAVNGSTYSHPYDQTGSITSYSWNFGDGSTATGATASHTYPNNGYFPVTLTVADNHGYLDSYSYVAYVADAPPSVNFGVTVSGQSAAFDAGTYSSDSDGTIARYAWLFGDGTSSTTATTSHTYPAPGTYHVTLTETDNFGLSQTYTKPVTLAGATTVSGAPYAYGYTTATTGRTITVDGSYYSYASSGASIVSYDWSWGDGTAGSGATATHTYPNNGYFPVTLTVTDNQGRKSNYSYAAYAYDTPPSVNFASTVSGQSVAFDAGTYSSDSDGTIASYAWLFGDGTSRTGATTSHTYPAPGTYQVTLTETDNFGLSQTYTKPVTIS